MRPTGRIGRVGLVLNAVSRIIQRMNLRTFMNWRMGMFHPPAPPRLQIRHFVAALIAIGLAVMLVDSLNSWLWPRNWGVVEPGGLYRCGTIPAHLAESTFSRYDIDLVIDFTKEEPGEPHQIAEKTAVKTLGINHIRLPMSGDGRGPPENYVRALSELAAARADNRAVVVRCAAGAQRTGAAMALYRILIQEWSTERALAEMGCYGVDRKDDAVLLKYLDENIAAITRGLVEQGVLPSVPDPLPAFRDAAKGVL